MGTCVGLINLTKQKKISHSKIGMAELEKIINIQKLKSPKAIRGLDFIFLKSIFAQIHFLWIL